MSVETVTISVDDLAKLLALSYAHGATDGEEHYLEESNNLLVKVFPDEDKLTEFNELCGVELDILERDAR